MTRPKNPEHKPTQLTDTQLRDFLEASPIGAAILERMTGRRLFANTALARAFGASSREELRDRDISETWVNPDDFHRAMSVLKKDQGLINFEAERKRLDGTRWWVLMNTQRQVFEGKDAGIVWHIDITERKLVEQELRESQAYFSSVTENLPGTVYRRVLHDDGSISLPFMSSRADEIFRRDADRTMHDPDYLLQSMLPEDLPRYLEAMRVSAEQLTPLDIELRFPDENGEIKWSHSISHPRKMENGDIVWDGIAFDVTGRKLAEEALRESEQQFRVLASNVPGGLLYIDAEGRYQFVNKVYANWFGLAPEDFVGRTAKDVLGEKVDDEVHEHLLAALSGQKVTYEAVRHSAELGTRDVQVANVPNIAADGTVEGVFTLVTDVSDLKFRARALEESQRNLAEAQRVGQIGHWRINTETGLADWSAEMHRIWGHDSNRASVTLDDILNAIHPDDRSDVITARDTAIAENRPYGLEFRILRPNGEIRYVRNEGGPEFDAKGKLVSIFGISQDITERKKAENALRDSETNFRELVEGSLQGVSVFDESQRFFVNQAYAEMLGYGSPGELMKNVATIDAFAPYERQRLRDRVSKRLATGGQPEPFEADMVRKDGSIIAVLVMGKRVAWYGKPAILSTVVNITDRKRSEEALKKSEERFRALIENALDIITILGPDGTILFESPSVERVLGYKHEELVGSSILELLHPDDVPQALVALQRTMQTPGLVNEIELRIRHKDGSWRHLQAIGRNLLEHPSVGGIILNSRDVTDHLRLEEQLSQAQKMEAVGQLTGGVAHDFNNLLAVIMGNLELLLEKSEPDSSLNSFAMRALSATQRGADLTHRLLAFSRRQPLQPVSVDINRLVEGMQDLLVRTLGEAIEIELVISAGLWQCEVDPGQLENAILNLSINARDAMPQGGKLTIETENTRLEDAYAAALEDVTPGPYVLLAISDTGTGMSRDVVAQAFDPFFTTKDVGKGTGLGLSMIYGFVKQSGGHARIYSELGEGTTVKIYLPRSTGGAGARLETDVNTVVDTSARGERVLVVEDDADVRTVAISILDELGYEVLEAGTASAALEQIERRTGEINLLLTDVILPGGMGGRELADNACSLLPSLKVLYMSGYTENAIIHHGRLDEGVQLLVKPFGRVELAVKVRQILDGGP